MNPPDPLIPPSRLPRDSAAARDPQSSSTVSGFETICAHFGEDRLKNGGGASPPIYQSSTFIYPDAGTFARRNEPGNPYFDYTRVGNPTTAILEAKLARLENGEWGRCFGSGMGAISSCINACVESGAHVIAAANCYGPAREYLSIYLKRFGVEVTFVTGVDPARYAAAIRPNTRLAYLESPTSGMFETPDLAALVKPFRERGIRTLHDNSWASPYFFTPLDCGVDLVVHSATKYIGGHSDVVAGVVVGRDAAIRDKVAKEAELLGATLDPFAAWLLIRGLRTLPVRMEYHQKSGLRIAAWLAEQPQVRRVHHPGLASHPQHAIARRQFRGFAGLFSFELHAQSAAATHALINRLRLFSIGVSWGGHESLVVGGRIFDHDTEHPAWVIRLHIGLESTDDLLADLRQGLEGVS